MYRNLLCFSESNINPTSKRGVLYMRAGFKTNLISIFDLLKSNIVELFLLDLKVVRFD